MIIPMTQRTKRKKRNTDHRDQLKLDGFQLEAARVGTGTDPSVTPSGEDFEYRAARMYCSPDAVLDIDISFSAFF